MAVSPKKAVERARAKWDAASSAYCRWAIDNGYGHVRRDALEKIVADIPEGAALLASDHNARKALDEAESAAVAAGHAWRDGTFGSVQFYSSSDIRRFAAQRRHACP